MRLGSRFELQILARTRILWKKVTSEAPDPTYYLQAIAREGLGEGVFE